RALAGRELRVGNRIGQVGRWCLRREADHGAVDVDTGRSVRSRLTGGRVDAGEQVGAGRGEVEDLHLVDLPRVDAFLDRLVGPETELRVPERAVGVGVPGIAQRREIAEDVEEVATVPKGVDQRGVAGAGVLGGV